MVPEVPDAPARRLGAGSRTRVRVNARPARAPAETGPVIGLVRRVMEVVVEWL